MNKEEVKFDHFKDIEELIQHLEMWYAEDDYFAFDRYFHLRDARIMGMFIYELQQEHQQLKEVIEEVREYVEKTPIGSILEVHCGDEEEYTKPLLQILDKGVDK